MAESEGAERTRGRRYRRFRHALIKRLASMLPHAGERRGRADQPALDPASILQVMVVRVNGRMGNTLFLTPLLTAIHELLPGAQIDVFVTYPDARDILRGMPGLRDVITLPHKGWWHLGDSMAMLKACRAHRYDLVIDPARSSAGGRVLLSLLRARWRLGFGGEDQWLRLDYAANYDRCDRHEALRPLGLLQQAFGYALVPGKARLRIANSDDELAAGARLLAERLALAARQSRPGSPVIGFFASARGRKDLGPDWWRAFWQAYLELQPDTVPVEVLPTANHPPIDPRFATLHCPSPRMLAATMSHVDVFFSADTGPMHLASAAGMPTIAFFNRTDPAAFGPIKPDDTVLHVEKMTPREVAATCVRLVASRPVASGRSDRSRLPGGAAAGRCV
jgi:heptosyltransferase III